MSFNTDPRVMENLFLNTLKFEFLAESVTLYFSSTAYLAGFAMRPQRLD